MVFPDFNTVIKSIAAIYFFVRGAGGTGWRGDAEKRSRKVGIQSVLMIDILLGMARRFSGKSLQGVTV